MTDTPEKIVDRVDLEGWDEAHVEQSLARLHQARDRRRAMRTRVGVLAAAASVVLVGWLAWPRADSVRAPHEVATTTTPPAEPRVTGELRFEDHFWLLHLTPLEISAVLFRKRTLDIELFVRARGAVTGKLIDSFLLDPNGFQNESAQATLDRATGGDRFHGFFRLVISRRLD